ncbi:Hsp70-Hsp90 organizing protein 3 [Diplonema papillatum]|nr:Hsp70-Hsp90 organizing protein 3 [Diplonema papillatum]
MAECPYMKEHGTCPVAGCPACKASEVSDRAKLKAEKAKADGNEAFKAEDYRTALRHYSLAVNLVPTSHVYRSNRSAAYSALGQYKEALTDAQKTTEIDPSWPKGYSRAALAFRGLRFFHLAAEAYEKAIAHGEDTEKNKTGAAECQKLAGESGFGRDDEVRTLAEQQDAENQSKMLEAGCCLM